jgi:hypothetical protein
LRAMQIIEWGKPLEARQYPDPEPKGEEVLLRVEAAGVCHSDVHIWDGHFDLGGGQQISLESRGVRLPFTMGHEIAGEVAALDHEPRVSRSATRWRHMRGYREPTFLTRPDRGTAAISLLSRLPWCSSYASEMVATSPSSAVNASMSLRVAVPVHGTFRGASVPCENGSEEPPALLRQWAACPGRKTRLHSSSRKANTPETL